MNLKILCQNLRYAGDKNEMGTDNDAAIRRHRFHWLVKKYDADIVCMQEVNDVWLEMLQQDFGAEYEMYYQYRGALRGSDEAQPVMWKKDKYEKLEEGSFWLSETPDQANPPGFDQYYPRICNWVRLKEKASGKISRIFSTHFGFYETNYPIEVIRSLFEEQVKKAGEESCFFMGDFNIGYQNEQYQVLMDTDVYYDLRPAAEAIAKKKKDVLGELRQGSFNGFQFPDGNFVIDFIIVGSNAAISVEKFGYCYERPAVLEKGIGEGWVSDHFAVYTEVEI